MNPTPNFLVIAASKAARPAPCSSNRSPEFHPNRSAAAEFCRKDLISAGYKRSRACVCRFFFASAGSACNRERISSPIWYNRPRIPLCFFRQCRSVGQGQIVVVVKPAINAVLYVQTSQSCVVVVSSRRGRTRFSMRKMNDESPSACWLRLPASWWTDRPSLPPCGVMWCGVCWRVCAVKRCSLSRARRSFYGDAYDANRSIDQSRNREIGTTAWHCDGIDGIRMKAPNFTSNPVWEV